MNIKEALEKISKNISKLVYTSTYNTVNGIPAYTASALLPLKGAIKELDDIPFIADQIDAVKKTGLLSNLNDIATFSSENDSNLKALISELKTGLQFLLKYYNATERHNDSVVEVKLPDVTNFDDLSKVSNDLKKAIEIPVNESNTNGEVKILSAEHGSIWIIVSLGTIATVQLIAAICWAAAVIRKKMAEARMFEAHAKTLDLKNEAIETFVNAQKTQVSNVLSAEAEAIANKYYDMKEPDVLSRLQLSISTVAELIDKGGKIVPSSTNEEIKKNFPDYSNLELISSSIKQISPKG